VTYVSENVAFEIGYAIGIKKRCLLFVNGAQKGDRELANNIGIFDTLGYEQYENSQTLTGLLVNRTDFSPIEFETAINHQQPVYIVEPAKKNDAHLMLVSRTKKARWKYRSFNDQNRPLEISRPTLSTCEPGVLSIVEGRVAQPDGAAYASPPHMPRGVSYTRWLRLQHSPVLNSARSRRRIRHPTGSANRDTLILSPTSTHMRRRCAPTSTSDHFDLAHSWDRTSIAIADTMRTQRLSVRTWMPISS
jgi:hypothetical protein